MLLRISLNTFKTLNFNSFFSLVAWFARPAVSMIQHRYWYDSINNRYGTILGSNSVVMRPSDEGYPPPWSNELHWQRQVTPLEKLSLSDQSSEVLARDWQAKSDTRDRGRTVSRRQAVSSRLSPVSSETPLLTVCLNLTNYITPKLPTNNKYCK